MKRSRGKKLCSSVQCIHSKPVLMLLLWLLVLGFCNELMLKTNLDSPSSNYIFINFNNVQYMFYPLLGILMDMWSLRLKMMKFCAFVSILWLLLNLVNHGLTFVASNSLKSASDFITGLKWTAVVLFTVTFSLFRTNIIPLYMDQMMESSSNELSAVIYWHTFVLVLPALLGYIVFAIIAEESHLFIIQTTLFLFTLYIIPCSYSNVPSRAYEDHPQVTNPIKLVYKVTKYCLNWKKNNRHRSAFTYWEDECPSKLDLGKMKYGGPFTEGEVEDVKTVVRMIPILTCTIGHLSIIDFDSMALAQTFSHFFTRFDIQLLPSYLTFYGSVLVLIFFHQFILRPFCFPLIPKMLTRMGLGLFFSLLSSATMILVSFVNVDNRSNIICPNSTYTIDLLNHGESKYISLLFLLPLLLNGMSYFLLVTSSLEFTVAQSPVHMRGLLVGVWYMFWGIGTMVKVNIDHSKGCIFVHWIIFGILNLVILIIFLFFARCYKLRMRNMVYNAYQITEDKVMRNIEESPDSLSLQTSLNIHTIS